MAGHGYLPKDCEWTGQSRLGIFNEFAIVRPVGALDGKVGLCQVTAEDCRGLVADLGGFSNDVWGFM